MVKVKEVLEYMNELAPVEMKWDFDNVGLLVGRSDAPVDMAVVALDITSKVIDEARDMGAQLIVSHHPVIFEPLKSVTDGDETGKNVLELISADIAAICMHTNLDAAEGGVNDALARKLGLDDLRLLNVDGVTEKGVQFGIGRIGELPEPLRLPDFLARTKRALGTEGIRYVDGGKAVKKVAVVGGSGGSDMYAAVAGGCDTLVTADLKHNHFISAAELGLNLIDASHFCTENVIVPVVAEKLKKRFDTLEIRISASCCQPESFYV
ncbi:MAG: Nif3-like dinuclear metal center hexameric protein [Oscillospiraceae bacterium]|nr:Nif3-like dinuclear metal center hexameric protein [Oscillospiraceae bacterium]